MRPYMLWLAMAYAGVSDRFPVRVHGGSGALDDWVRYQSAQRFLVSMGRR